MFLSKGFVRKSVLAGVGLGFVGVLHLACGADANACLRMSDCEAPFVCVDGTCRSDETLGTQPPDGSASDQ